MCTWEEKTNNKKMLQHRPQTSGADSKSYSTVVFKCVLGHQVEELLYLLSVAPEGKTGGIFCN